MVPLWGSRAFTLHRQRGEGRRLELSSSLYRCCAGRRQNREARGGKKNFEMERERGREAAPRRDGEGSGRPPFGARRIFHPAKIKRDTWRGLRGGRLSWLRELQSLLGGATAGLHTMTDEHFGISVVEYMAAGAIPIAHNSGGPKQDIVLDEDGVPTGFLATTATEFAAAILHVGGLPPAERLEVAGAARRRAARFSEANFDRDFKAALAPLLLKL